jgi:nucleoid-associated protein YgaU
MQLPGPARGLPVEWRKAILCCSVVFSFCTFRTSGQEVAEAARQEKASKAAEQTSAKHVYTEEDLKKKVILTPEDQARVEARKQQQTPVEQNAEQLPSNADPNAESLGEIARRFRAEQAAREAELQAKKKFTIFPYQFPEDVLAEPRLGVDPLTAPGSGVAIVAPPMAPAPVRPSYTLRPSRPAVSPRRISPFQPRPLTGLPSVPPSTMLALPGIPLHAPEVPRAVEKTAEKTLPVPVGFTGVRQIEVLAGQSWWKLAELYLGDGTRWPELRRLNAMAGGPPELLKRGSLVLVPEATKKIEVSSHTIPLQKGDSLWSLAEEHFGRGSAWVCVAAANPQIVAYTHLAVGTLVRLPETGELRSCQSHNGNPAKR